MNPSINRRACCIYLSCVLEHSPYLQGKQCNKEEEEEEWRDIYTTRAKQKEREKERKKKTSITTRFRHSELVDYVRHTSYSLIFLLFFSFLPSSLYLFSFLVGAVARASSRSQSISDRFHWLDRTLAPVAHWCVHNISKFERRRRRLVFLDELAHRSIIVRVTFNSSPLVYRIGGRRDEMPVYPCLYIRSLLVYNFPFKSNRHSSQSASQSAHRLLSKWIFLGK